MDRRDPQQLPRFFAALRKPGLSCRAWSRTPWQSSSPGESAVKIDAFSHVWPERYIAKRRELEGSAFRDISQRLPQLWDVEARIRNMDEDGINKQVITLAVPPVEQTVSDPKQAAALAALANDSIADMAALRPDRIIPTGVVALNDVEPAL